MQKSANFVDAGYLYAAGSALLLGKKHRRVDLALEIDLVLDALRAINATVAPGIPTLRTYWYDGLLSGQETPEQRRIAETANLKARFGVVNTIGEQKGVDSLMVIDLIDLARDRVVSDAFILAGDEDLRVGVEVAQRYGVRVHLIGITPCRGNQSNLLRREADTTHEWDDSVVGAFLSLRTLPAAPQRLAFASPASPVGSEAVAAPHLADGDGPRGGADVVSQPHDAAEIAAPAEPASDASASAHADADAHAYAPGDAAGIGEAPLHEIHAAVSATIDQLAKDEMQATLDQWARGAGLPYEVDRQLLRAFGTAAPGDIDMGSKRELRRSLIARLKALNPAPREV